MCACYPYGPTIVSSTFTVDLSGVGRALALTNVGRPSYLCSGPYSSYRPSIVPSGSDVALE